MNDTEFAGCFFYLFRETASSLKEGGAIVIEIARRNKSIYANNNKREIKSLTVKGNVFKKGNKYILSDPVFEL